MWAKSFLILTLLIGVLSVGGCKDKDGGGAGQYEVAVMCSICKAEASMSLPSPPEKEIWPKPCPSCGRSGAYPCVQCKECQKKVLFMDPRTKGYAVPTVCPHCGKPLNP